MKNDYEIRGDVTAIFLRRKDGTVLETLISTSDLEKVNQFPNTWYAGWNPPGRQFYVRGSLFINEKRKNILLHRFIFDYPHDMNIDHINHETLNNSRPNLRVVTHAQNAQNKKGPAINNKSGVRGVCWNKNSKSWEAGIKLNGKRIYIGSFKDLKEAKKAVIEARKIYMPYSIENLEG